MNILKYQILRILNEFICSKINIYKNGAPLTTIKMVQGGPKNVGLVQITTPVKARAVRILLVCILVSNSLKTFVNQ